MLQVGENLQLLNCPPAIPTIWWGIQLWGLGIESPSTPAFPTWWEESFPGLLPPNDMVNSEAVVGVQPGDTVVVIGYQVDEYTCTWSTEWFVACSHIYPGVTGKVSSLNHFPLEAGCEDYSFLDQAAAVFKQDFDSTLTDSIETPELDTSFDETDVITSSVSSGFLPSVLFVILLISSLLLASVLVNYGARLGHFFLLCI